VHFDTGAKRLFAFAPDGLALARGESAEKIVEGGIVVVLPMKLLVGPLQKAALAKRGPFRFGQEGDMRRR